MDEFYHEPVLVRRVVELLVQKKDGLYLDGTLGGGGHSAAILSQLGGAGKLISVDRDQMALDFASRRLGKHPGLELRHACFSEAAKSMSPCSLAGAFFDLGVSSRQLDDLERGFSFRSDVPVDMRMDLSESRDAGAWLRQVDEADLAQGLRVNADLPRARAVAIALKKMSSDLGSAVPSVGDFETSLSRFFPRDPKEKRRFLSRVFQALRMEVNSELDEIRNAIHAVTPALSRGGRLIFLTYHSVEDRTVKQTVEKMRFPSKRAEILYGPGAPVYSRLVRRPELPGEEERNANPRSRSAKLRAYEKQ